jgi:hypothetical protein
MFDMENVGHLGNDGERPGTAHFQAAGHGVNPYRDFVTPRPVTQLENHPNAVTQTDRTSEAPI